MWMANDMLQSLSNIVTVGVASSGRVASSGMVASSGRVALPLIGGSREAGPAPGKAGFLLRAAGLR